MLLSDSITQHAVRDGNAIAFKCGAEQLSYSELDRSSNQLAHTLLRTGLVSGNRVGVFMPRHLHCSIAIYGIIKAGGIFVPIDPHLSAGAVSQLLIDAGIRHLVTHPKKFRVLQKLARISNPLKVLVSLERCPLPTASPLPSAELISWQTVTQASSSSPELVTPISSESPAYMMYSSGSTGHPKGIVHTHRSGLAYVRLSIETYAITDTDVIAGHPPINFDMSTLGYFVGPHAGATTILISEAHTKMPVNLAQLVADEAITIWYSVPLALIQLLERGNLSEHQFPHLRWIKFAGEPFPPKYLRPFMRLFPHARFSNIYGPAEVNQCTYFHLPEDYPNQSEDTPIPIGRIWPETDSCIIDENDNPVAPGSTGELAVHSPTMMSGYWGRPEQSASALLHRIAPDGQSRSYYRTGDLVRERVPHQIEFLGRKDRQIKIRGYRVELEEVEHALNQHPAVAEAGVYWINSGEAKEIHAAIQSAPQQTPDVAQIRIDLAAMLSPYAIPSFITVVDQFPRTSSGKIDRSQLKLSLSHHT